LEDPDETIYEQVSNRILEYGDLALPYLEHAWETADNSEQQQRTESIIRRIHFTTVELRMKTWMYDPKPDLWTGLLIVDQLHHREDRSETLNQSLEQVRRNAWLELNQYLTPLEQINVLSRMIFEHERFKGIDAARERIEHLFIGDILVKRTGSQIGLGLLTLVLAEKLDLPLFAVQVPGIFVLGSPSMIHSRPQFGIDSIDFYLDPQSGELFGRAEIEHYLRRLHQPPEPTFFEPLSHAQLMRSLLKNIELKALDQNDQDLATQAAQLQRLC
jgi:regulator of sirC expression with transglutaminase-like and TPR domain